MANSLRPINEAAIEAQAKEIGISKHELQSLIIDMIRVQH